MSSPKQIKVSGANLHAWIEAGLRSMAKAKIKDKDDIISIKFDPAGHIFMSKIYTLEIITERTVKVKDIG